MKNQRNVRLLLELLEKRLSSKLSRFWFLIFFILFNHFSPGKDSSNSTTCKHQYLRIPSAMSINLDIIRKLIEYSLKEVHVKAMLTLTVFEILLFKARSVLWPVQRATGTESVKGNSSSEHIKKGTFENIPSSHIKRSFELQYCIG